MKTMMMLTMTITDDVVLVSSSMVLDLFWSPTAWSGSWSCDFDLVHTMLTTHAEYIGVTYNRRKPSSAARSFEEDGEAERAQ